MRGAEWQLHQLGRENAMSTYRLAGSLSMPRPVHLVLLCLAVMIVGPQLRQILSGSTGFSMS